VKVVKAGNDLEPGQAAALLDNQSRKQDIKNNYLLIATRVFDVLNNQSFVFPIFLWNNQLTYASVHN
jgi:hypothetical protein